MSVEPVQNNFINKIGRQNISPKDYEKIVFDNLKLRTREKENYDSSFHFNNAPKSRWRTFKDKFLQIIQRYVKVNVETQFEVYQSSMKYCFLIGQCLGLFPIMNITGRGVQKKYNILSWRYSICFTILLAQIVTTVLSCYRMLTNKFSITTASNFIFFASNLITSVQFIRLSTKWHHLIELVATSNLDEYVDPYVKFKGNIAAIFLLTFAFIEHALSFLGPFNKMLGCSSNIADALKKASLISFPWIFKSIVPYSHAVMIIVEIFVVGITMIWTYSQLFIIYVSLFLTSILDGLNKKLTAPENKLLPASCWQTVRQDYNRAVGLVRFFDDAINGIVFMSFATNLFFVCSRLYYLLVEGFVFGNDDDYSCLHRNKWYGYEDIIYNLGSTVFFIIRTFLVSLVAANIHSASLTVAPLLYSIPSSSFCIEVHRFLEQIHSTTVALTGLKFFYVTKETILSMIGTIITYELVLLQFKK